MVLELFHNNFHFGGDRERMTELKEIITNPTNSTYFMKALIGGGKVKLVVGVGIVKVPGKGLVTSIFK